MNIQSIILLAVIALALTAAVVSILRRKNTCPGCCGSCEGCKACSKK